jgi:hypothetical protein
MAASATAARLSDGKVNVDTSVRLSKEQFANRIQIVLVPWRNFAALEATQHVPPIMFQFSGLLDSKSTAFVGRSRATYKY